MKIHSFIAIAASALVLAASVSAQAQGKITFTNAGDIWVIDADGANSVNLTDRIAHDFWSRWSPDGTRIVFSSVFEGTDLDIWVMDADGANHANLTDNERALDAEPAWSPDGTRIAFWSDRIDDNRDIWVMDADGANPTRLTELPGSEENPAWSPDGTRLLFNSDRQLYSMDASGADMQLLQESACCSSWSPGGAKIAFHSDRDGNKEIYTMNADGTNPVRLTDNRGSDLVPKWLPDGTRIIFGSFRDGAMNVYMMNDDGTNVVNLTSDPALSGQLPDWSDPAGGAVPNTAVDVRSLGFIKQLMR